MRLGERGEDLAVSYLKKSGYRIIERNYRNPFGEIDIIALHSGTIVFVEVKTRKTDEYGMPFEAVNYHKQRKLKNTALMYLKRFKKGVSARFDVVSIFMNNGEEKVRLIKDAFEF
ncbi:hypothetical protein BMS3Abin07_00403 [bacterium BMS3Abin07]|nr:hypothetical protein BMS3Abin07_00403 [bacterium BMS3Abin07]GBE32784.1 hypothetical protein BMS3Bbin05_01705 [bacterium BMS3Bbin05]HDL20497.1 YraN family protein [Nitrospirota bacterium]HDO22936.1 YraN family protein [Nitrospirota bacterium]